METGNHVGTHSHGNMVVSLPMRDGNVDECNHSTVLVFVVSLPMRDGNRGGNSHTGDRKEVVSLPMRDGNK